MDVSAVARGYLALINANNRGQGISQAADFLQPVVDITDLLGVSLRRVNTGSAAIPATANFTQNIVTVPTNETWKIRGGGIVLQVGGGSTFVQTYLRAVVSNATNSTPMPISQTYNLSTSPTSQTVLIEPPGLLLESGTIIELSGTTTGLVCQIFWAIAYDRLTG